MINVYISEHALITINFCILICTKKTTILSHIYSLSLVKKEKVRKLSIQVFLYEVKFCS